MSRSSAHFVVRTRQGKDTLLAPYALEALEKAYAGLTEDPGMTRATRSAWRSAIGESLAHVSR